MRSILASLRKKKRRKNAKHFGESKKKEETQKAKHFGESKKKEETQKAKHFGESVLIRIIAERISI